VTVLTQNEQNKAIYTQISGVRIAVVIPAYKCKEYIVDVVSEIPEMVWRIYVVDDACPEKSGDTVNMHVNDPRLCLIYNDTNQGVGGAVMTGYRAAIDEGADIIVKIDGDGQMDPSLILQFVLPILHGEADYTKGNRFYNLEEVSSMPTVRLFGNAVLSLMTKISSGYWNIFDSTNGYTAIHTDVAKHLPFKKISQRYFFEIDMLFRLNIHRAVVVDIPMSAKYGEEVSNLNISKIIGEFLFKNMRNFLKRIFYNYYLRDMSLASIELPVGLSMLFFGVGFGSYHWYLSSQLGSLTAPGTVMLAAMPVLLGLQLILAFIGSDIASVPKRVLHQKYFNLQKKSEHQ